MRRDSLATLIKLRQIACDDAARNLAHALAEEDKAERHAQHLERSIVEETKAASDVDGSDAMVEAFGAWLTQARQRARAARSALADRQAETARVRAELTACRTALESVEALQTERQVAARKASERQQTRELDDRRPFPVEPAGPVFDGA